MSGTLLFFIILSVLIIIFGIVVLIYGFFFIKDDQCKLYFSKNTYIKYKWNGKDITDGYVGKDFASDPANTKIILRRILSQARTTNTDKQPTDPFIGWWYYFYGTSPNAPSGTKCDNSAAKNSAAPRTTTGDDPTPNSINDPLVLAKLLLNDTEWGKNSQQHVNTKFNLASGAVPVPSIPAWVPPPNCPPGATHWPPPNPPGVLGCSIAWSVKGSGGEGQNMLLEPMPQDSDVDNNHNIKYKVLNVGGWGGNPNSVTRWTPASADYLALDENIDNIQEYCTEYGYNAISLDIEGCTDSTDPSAPDYQSAINNYKKKYPPKPCTTKSVKSTYMDLDIQSEPYIQTNDKPDPAPAAAAEKFGKAVNQLLMKLRNKKLYTILTIPGFGISKKNGGMDWFTYIHPDNMTRICFMYYNQSCDTEIAASPFGKGYYTKTIINNTYGLLFSPLYDGKRILGTSCGFGCSTFKTKDHKNFDKCIKQLFTGGISVWRKALPFQYAQDHMKSGVVCGYSCPGGLLVDNEAGFKQCS